MIWLKTCCLYPYQQFVIIIYIDAGLTGSWWCHQMEICSALLALCAGNSPVTGEFPLQRPVMRSFDVSLDLHLNRQFSKQLRHWSFEMPSRSLWHHSNDATPGTLRHSGSVNALPCVTDHHTSYVPTTCIEVNLNWFHIKNVSCEQDQRLLWWADFAKKLSAAKMSSAKWQLFCLSLSVLTHWGWVTHMWVNDLTIICSDNGLSPGWRQAIIWTNDGILLIGPLRTNFSEILIEIHAFSFKKIHLKMSSAKWRPFCLSLSVLISFLTKGTQHREPFIQHKQYHGCWLPGDTCSQSISSHISDLIFLECSSLNSWKVTMNMIIQASLLKSSNFKTLSKVSEDSRFHFLYGRRMTEVFNPLRQNKTATICRQYFKCVASKIFAFWVNFYFISFPILIRHH